ncbi:MAG: hypothetical protein HGGPFJEG_02518 [Ignavibacteria bacterium]|nr:hypothetical protein [Ignavibacteria bacterium]
MDKVKKAPKAYENSSFMNSPGGRNVRILTEYMEPFERFRKYKIKHTIVFFGSARILPKKEARQKLLELKEKMKSPRNNNKKLEIDLKIAEANMEMSKYYEDTVQLAYLMTKWAKSLKKPNKFIVCSGGGPGIMEAANKGAAKAKGFSMGLNISLPFEQYPNKFISPELNFEFHYFFMRKFWFAYLAKALVIMPGGFGTLDELMEILTLVQTEKLHKKITVVIYGKEFWDKIIDLDKLAELQMISKEDLKLFKFANTPEEAFEYLKKELIRNYVIK